MVRKYNNLSFLFFIPGTIAQFAGLALNKGEMPDSFTSLAAILMAIGTVLAITGFGYYAKAKGRSMAFGLVGFLGLLGLAILAILKDRSGDPWNT